MPTIGRPFTAVTATLLPTGMRYLLAAVTGAVAISPVRLTLTLAISYWLRVSPLQHRTPLQMPRLVRSTFRSLALAIEIRFTIRTLLHSISRLSHQRFEMPIV